MTQTEQEKARYYREHKDDDSLWEEPETQEPPRQERALSITLAVRFTPKEAEVLRALAQERKTTYAAIVREAVRRYHQDYRHLDFSTGQATQVYPSPPTTKPQALRVTLGGTLQALPSAQTGQLVKV